VCGAIGRGEVKLKARPRRGLYGAEKAVAVLVYCDGSTNQTRFGLVDLVLIGARSRHLTLA
jgi:hypothetical protein